MALFRKYGWIALLWLVAEVLFLYFTDSRWLFTYLFFSPVEVFQKNYPDYWWLVYVVMKVHMPAMSFVAVWFVWLRIVELLAQMRKLKQIFIGQFRGGIDSSNAYTNASRWVVAIS